MAAYMEIVVAVDRENKRARNNLSKQYLVYKKNNSRVINGQSLYSNLFGFDSHITFKWGSRKHNFPY